MKKNIHRISAFLIAVFLIIGISVPVYAQTVEDNTDSQQKKVRVAMLQYPNFIDYDENGKASGFSCDYLDEIAKYTGWTYE